MPQQTFTAVIEFDSESRMYIGSVPQLPGAFTQGATLDDLRQNLIEVVELVLAELTA
jgi:predicted RNase H-like HicB family nuclease